MFNSVYLNDLEKEIAVAAKMADIDIEDAKELVDAYFKSIDYLADDDRIPEIQVQSIGTLKFSNVKANGLLSDRERPIPMKKETRETREIQIKHIRDRIEREDRKEKGIGFFWSFVPRNFVELLYKKDD